MNGKVLSDLASGEWSPQAFPIPDNGVWLSIHQGINWFISLSSNQDQHDLIF